MDLTDMLDFHGVSRSALEQRIAQLVTALANLEQQSRDLEQRIRGRAQTNAETHRATGSRDADVRFSAYETALGDLHEILLQTG